MTNQVNQEFMEFYKKNKHLYTDTSPYGIMLTTFQAATQAKCEQAEPVAKVILTKGIGLMDGKTIPKVMLDLKYLDLPSGTKLYTIPPDQSAEIERLKAQNEKLLASLKLALIEMLALPSSLGLEITHTIDMELLIKEVEESK